MVKKTTAILLIEPVSDQAEAFERLLVGAGDEHSFAVYRATSQTEATEILQTINIDAMVVNVDTPSASQESLIRSLHQQWPSTPCIALVGESQSVFAHRALRDGAVDYVIREQMKTRALQHTISVACIRAQVVLAAPRDDAFANAMPHPVLELSSRGELIYFNPAAEHMFPHLRELDAKHQILHGVLIVADMLRGQDNKTITREVRLDERFYEQEVSLVDSGHVRMYVSDITERKRLDRLKDEFLSTVSHELRTPLTIVKGALSNVVDGIAGPLNEKQEYVLRTADRNCDRLARIINDLLDLSRLESGKARLNRSETDIAGLVSDATENFALIAAENEITLRTDIPTNVGSVYADGDMITQVLTNLLDNAIRYCEGEVSARVSSSNEGFIDVSITDDGRGMSVEEQKKLFNKFAQMHRIAGGAGYKGTGLGLSISREIVEMHQGKIWVESVVGKGSTFHVSLPIYNAEAIFWDDYRAVIAESVEEKSPLTVCWVALRNGQAVIDQYGHVAVRNYIAAVEQALAENALRRADHVIHFSHTSFVVVLKADIAESARVVGRIEHILAECAQKVFTDPLQPVIALGTATFSAACCDAQTLLSQAQQAADSQGD